MDLNSGIETKQELRQALNNHCIDYIMQVKALHDTMQAVPQPAKWFALQPHVKDTLPSKVLCRVGARGKALHGG